MNINQEQATNILNDLLKYQKEVAAKYGVDVESDIELQKEFIIRNNAIGFEFEKLESALKNLQILKPLLHNKMKHTGMLFQILAKALLRETGNNKYDANDSYILASFYCNIGFLAIENSLYKEHYTTQNDEEIIKRHVMIGYELLSEKGLTEIAQIVKLHHEKPNGSGYLKEQNYDDHLLGLINIADEFIDAVLPSKKPETVLLKEEAIVLALKGYESNTLFDPDEVAIIKQTIHKYYQENFRS